MSMYTDEEIINMIRESTFSRERAFEYLFLDQELKNKAFSKINTMVQDKAVGEDIFLDSLLAFIKNVRYNRFKGESKISTYIVGICNFQCLRYLDRQKKERLKADNYKSAQINNTESEKSAEVMLVTIEENRYDTKLKRKICRLLSPACRDAFRNKYGKDLSVKDIAKLKDIAVQSVKNTLSRCYKKLRELIEEDPEIMEAIKRNYGRL